VLEQLIKREPDVFGDLTKQDGGDVSTLMKRNRCATARSIAELFVGPALTDFDETEFDEDGDDFLGFEDGNVTHDSSYGNVLNPNKLGLQYGLTIFQKHCNNIAQVVVDFIQRLPLGMRTGKTGNKANEQACLWAPLNYR